MQDKTSADLKRFVNSWHSDFLRGTAIAAIEKALDVSENIDNWKYSDSEQQWTAEPNFVAFRFPKTKDSFTCWIYTQGRIHSIDGLEFQGSRPKDSPTYQSVTITSPEQLSALKKYIAIGYRLKQSR